MKLQQLLDENKITQAWLAKSLNISPPAMNAIVKHGVWPKRNPEAVKQKLIETLTLSGVELTLINQALTATSPLNPSVETTIRGEAASLEEEQLMLLRKQTLSEPAKKQFKLFKNIFPHTSKLACGKQNKLNLLCLIYLLPSRYPKDIPTKYPTKFRMQFSTAF